MNKLKIFLTTVNLLVFVFYYLPSHAKRIKDISEINEGGYIGELTGKRVQKITNTNNLLKLETKKGVVTTKYSFFVVVANNKFSSLVDLNEIKLPNESSIIT